MTEMTADQCFQEELIHALSAAGLTLNEDQLELMGRLHGLVLEWNARLNLTRITECREVAVKHFVDSLMLANYVKMPDGSSVVDIGSGAGFPGIPLKIWNRSLRVTLVESIHKKADFLRNAVSELGIELSVSSERAEDFGSQSQYRESFDLAVARAVAPFNVLCEYCLPLVRLGGTFASMKGPEASEEISAGRRALELLGGTLAALYRYSLPFGMGQRTLIVVTKTSPTPSAYPRRPGIPKKRPL